MTGKTHWCVWCEATDAEGRRDWNAPSGMGESLVGAVADLTQAVLRRMATKPGGQIWVVKVVQQCLECGGQGYQVGTRGGKRVCKPCGGMGLEVVSSATEERYSDRVPSRSGWEGEEEIKGVRLQVPENPIEDLQVTWVENGKRLLECRHCRAVMVRRPGQADGRCDNPACDREVVAQEVAA